MADKKCKYCAMQIPFEAKICPFCRKKQPMQFDKKTKILIAVGVLAWGAAISNHSPEPAKQESPQEAARRHEESEGLDAKLMAQQFVEKTLKAPATAKFPSALDVPAEKKKGAWDVYTYVDAQNSFGALIRTKFYVRLKPEGDKWKLLKIQPY